ncbi:MAG: 2-hydroxyglutaryl-CoA dehydratase [Bacillota bacterium]
MAELKYDKTGRLLFTKEMKKDFLILSPQMLPIHFEFLKQSFISEGFKFEVLNTNQRSIVDEGLKNVHNDTCYPALLVIGQMIDALKSGKYDLEKVALIITQTGGGCRASNYIHLLRKAMKKAGFGNIPVVSLNLSGLEKNPGFKLDFRFIKKIVFSLIYGDMLMLLANQARPYENVKGSTDDLVGKWEKSIAKVFHDNKELTFKRMTSTLKEIAIDFESLPITRVPKLKVGIVGEIYVKFAPLGNNNLEEFLVSEGVETVVPGVMDFVIFKTDNRLVDASLYGGNFLKSAVVRFLKNMFIKYQNDMIKAVKENTSFTAPVHFEDLKKLVTGYVGHGNKMGEGWLLTGEMLELINQGVSNIVCTQPFGCLPNHISGKGMIGLIKRNNPLANIVSIDYDPGATRINQENRIKLMLASAKLKD